MEHPHFVLGLTPDGWDWFFAMPYYWFLPGPSCSSEPWNMPPDPAMCWSASGSCPLPSSTKTMTGGSSLLRGGARARRALPPTRCRPAVR